MALKVKPEYVGIDKAGNNITIKDATGAYVPVTNPEGYGLPNLDVSDIDSIVFTLSAFSDDTVYKLTDTVIADVVAGEPITLNAQNLADQVDALQFEDGVYDLNEYVFVTDTFDIFEANLGENNIILSTPITEEYLNTFDSITDQAGNIYNIDKSKPFSATTIYLVEELLVNATTIRIGYRANIKFLNTRNFDYILGKQTTNCKPCGKQTSINILYNKIMAEEAFRQEDYLLANKLISGEFNNYC
jgi:hypothetical protein